MVPQEASYTAYPRLFGALLGRHWAASPVPLLQLEVGEVVCSDAELPWLARGLSIPYAAASAYPPGVSRMYVDCPPLWSHSSSASLSKQTKALRLRRSSRSGTNVVPTVSFANAVGPRNGAAGALASEALRGGLQRGRAPGCVHAGRGVDRRRGCVAGHAQLRSSRIESSTGVPTSIERPR
ncbi:hypothetical protein Mpe_B0030 (plasmid) [Methylibium petroleiphilum PM1]|uniref:Uncharacterized protein n=1 Tax=Methylibium petroleiphilum (strain ATCC BAA-1232 / LMG 22953 / PM1) TaxID=420662 RepID=A2SMM2_METPP|nr:hypothetical protein Mpe_B0030 [Methylibium petroleiphilum PM1]